MTLDNIPLGEALRYVANQAGLKVKVEPYAVAVIPLSEQSNELITKRYHVPPEFFGGPLDVGYYIGSSVAGGGGEGAGTTTGVREAPPVATNVIEKEAVSFQTASGTGTGAGASKPGKPTAKHCQYSPDFAERSSARRQGRCDNDVEEHGCLVSARCKRNVLAAQWDADRSQYAGQFGHGRCVG